MEKMLCKFEPIFIFYEDIGPVIWGYEILLRGGNGINLYEFFKNLDSETDLRLFMQFCLLLVENRKNVKDFVIWNMNERNVQERETLITSVQRRQLYNNFCLNIRIDTMLRYYAEVFSFVNEIERMTGFNIYVEITEENLTPEKVVMLRENANKLPLKVVLDDFGRQGANFDILRMLRPYFVKIDTHVVPLKISISIANWLIKEKIVSGVLFEKIENHKDFLSLYSKYSGEKFFYQGFLFQL